MVSSAWAPFDREPCRRELADRMNALPGVEVPAEPLELRPNVPLKAVGQSLPQFLAVLDWVFGEARKAASG
jgi:hypothetical protein